MAFGKTFRSFETTAAGRVLARFEDGSTAEGDVLVGADGAGSRVRRQLLPQAERVDTGIVMISGKFALSDAVRADTPAAVFKGPTMILGPRGGFLFTGAVEYEPNAATAPAHDRSEYVMWGFSMHREALGLKGRADELAGEAARATVLAQLRDWSPDLRRLVERAEASSLSAFAVKSSVPLRPWPTKQITLLGDALHNMTPFRGVGANTALRHAALLRDALCHVDDGRLQLLPALAGYEREMIEYGFAAVRASLAQMKRVHAQSPLKRFAIRTVFRALDTWPALRRRVVRLEAE